MSMTECQTQHRGCAEVMGDRAVVPEDAVWQM
jgi:hypothetical protein